MRDWQGKRIVILGAARQGQALAKYLAGKGARVTLSDRRSLAELADARQALADTPLAWVAGEHPLSLLDHADLLCLSGGVPTDLPIVQAARQKGIPLSNDSQIFLERVPCKTVGITGSAGKTTVTTLVGLMARQEYASPDTGSLRPKAWIGGNIGNPLIADLDRIHPDDLAVLELSSFQLELMTVSTSIAVILNITPNHLDRHGTMQAYTSAKAHLLDYQSSYSTAVIGWEDPVAWSLRSKVKGNLVTFGLLPGPASLDSTFIQGSYLILRQGEVERVIAPKEEVRLRGQHNLLNVLAACAIAAAAGLSTQAMANVIRSFYGVPHRLEFVRRWGGADWYNDSIATAPERTIAAIQSFSEPLVLLIGGRDKKLPWEGLIDLIHQRVDHLILFGEAAGLVARQLHHGQARPFSVHQCSGLHEAVHQAAQIVEAGDVVLLSPGGTSFDEFVDFEERGKVFRQWVNQLS